MAGRLLLRRVLVGHSEYALPVEPMGKRGGTQIQEAPETNWLQMPGHFATSARKNWWEKPSTGKFLTFRWSVPIPTVNNNARATTDPQYAYPYPCYTHTMYIVQYYK